MVAPACLSLNSTRCPRRTRSRPRLQRPAHLRDWTESKPSAPRLEHCHLNPSAMASQTCKRDKKIEQRIFWALSPFLRRHKVDPMGRPCRLWGGGLLSVAANRFAFWLNDRPVEVDEIDPCTTLSFTGPPRPLWHQRTVTRGLRRLFCGVGSERLSERAGLAQCQFVPRSDADAARAASLRSKDLQNNKKEHTPSKNDLPPVTEASVAIVPPDSL